MKLFSSQWESPLGALALVTDQAGAIYTLDFADHPARAARYLRERLGDYETVDTPAPGHIAAAFERYFGGELRALDTLPVLLAGTKLQMDVWQALRKIRAGQTCHYSEIARSLGYSDPRVAIDVGAANGANPIAIIVPCHRVIAKSGELKGYAWGVKRKIWLLNHEGVKVTVAAKPWMDGGTLALPGF
jgi:methylated-DNA-[protein]-cysteine S-methyltransferase